MPGLLELIVALSVLSLLLALTADEDAPSFDDLGLDDAALASVGWL
ncbi:MAG: hypothetical protein L6R19_11135 [Alphaproteobacteria bacterium]|nr:hypothetical protein [Alphaproteobacteria bacterium]